MPLGLQNATNTTLEQITNMTNVTNPAQFFVNVNNTAFNGIYFFIVIWVLVVIFYNAAQAARDQPLNNAMYSMAICSSIAILARIVGLLSDHLMWVFPLLTIMLATFIYALKRSPD